ncbi:MAG: rhomboid family intramembrane serine protease [Planctomycetes bacterium]|nr:rhomboid family intramembrane serine protease [Planctomycetota bacterium]
MIPLRDDNPTRHAPVVTIGLIAINVLVFLWQIAGGPVENLRRSFRFAAVPWNVTEGARDPAVRVVIDGPTGIQVDQFEQSRLLRPADHRVVRQPIPSWLTLLTSMFLHGGWMHLIGNMVFLWVFGNNIEDAVGRLRYLVFYLVCGVGATLAHVFSVPASMTPLVGASGAISGVLGAYLVLYPKARVLALVPIPPLFLTTLYLPAGIFLAIWFVLQISGLFRPDEAVAFWAHIGGFILGLALIKLLETTEHRSRPRGGGGQAGWPPRGGGAPPFGRGF